MRRKVQYLYLEIKKTFKLFPRMVLQAILLMMLISVIAFCGVKSMERNPLAVSVEIGVAAKEDNRMTRMAMSYVENMESVSQLCNFVQVSEEEGLSLLEHGEIAALIILPEQLVEGIMNGQNPSVDVVFPKDVRLEAMLFRELTESGAGLLQVAQAQIYGAIDTAKEYNLTDRLSVIETDIDSYNLAFALDRLAMYDEETVSATGRMSVLQYYAASGLVLFLFLTGMAVYPVMQRENPAFRRQLTRSGTGVLWQSFCRWLCGFICIGLLVCVAWVLISFASSLMPGVGQSLSSTLISGRNHGALFMRIGIILLMLVTVTTFINMIYSVTGSKTSSILLIFLFSVLLLYLSGGFIPSAMMPETLRTVGEVLPSAYLIRALGGLLAGYGEDTLRQSVAGMCVYTAVFGAVSYCIDWRKNDAI